MFTGIVEEQGTIIHIEQSDAHYHMAIAAAACLKDVKLGDSISVCGVCLTVTEFNEQQFWVGLGPETLAKTNLQQFKVGDKVNLERALLPTTRMGGHMVQGHVDGVATLTDVRPERDALWLTFQVAKNFMRYIVDKGFICVDGASLTVCETGADFFTLMLIAYSRELLTLGTAKVGYQANIEVDILSKYTEKLLGVTHES